ncbi:hypothetical protein KTH46_09180 [Acinetobacter bereziniae]|uniref:hypothetical protein n=1 Tax=Acinetobacter bereziniae TaxID=106648 RepID=UPI0021D1EA7A|nr:hypothetical protein [Acinetobacter bereziniae]MCU4315192.1 hypothetical protein [Acinetobacter bereziniae]
MNKYLTALVGMFLFQSAFADSYVFGGRAHFSGSLVNPSCLFAQESHSKLVENRETESDLELSVSNCSSTVYYNLAIALKDANNRHRISDSLALPEQAFYLMPGMNLHHSNVYQRSAISQVAHEVTNTAQEPELTNIDETVVLPLSKLSGQSTENSKNILISVFYP